MALCPAGTISNGIMMSCSGKLLAEKVDVLRLTFYTSPVSCIMLLPFYSQLERGRFGQYASEHADKHYGSVVLLTCVVALCYNLVHYQVIKHTSAVTTTVLGEMKIVTILVLSSVILGEY